MNIPLKEVPIRLSTGASCRVSRGSDEARVGVIVLHPWSALGGSLHDPHVVVAARYFGHAGCATARIQFRTGFSCGPSPISDVSAAAQYLLDIPHIEKILVIGYSYGSIVAMASAEALPEDAVLGWVAIAPPLDYAWALFLFNGSAILDQIKNFKTPITKKLLLHPTRDQFCTTRSFDKFVAGLPDPKLSLKVQGAHHFDLVNEIPDALTQFLRDQFDTDNPRTFARQDYGES